MIKKFPAIPILSLFLMALLAACGGGEAPAEEAEAEAQEAPAEEEAGTPVEVAEAETGDIALIYTYTGDLEAKDDVDLIPETSGRVDSVLVEVGDEVAVGDTIATVEQDRYRAQLKQAEAQLRTAELNLEKLEIGSRPEEIAVAQAAVNLARAQLDDVATIDADERTDAAAELARTQAELRRAQAEYDKIAWAGDVGETEQALALEQATIAYENALARYNLDTNPSDSELAPLMTQLAQAELNLILTRDPYRQVDFAIAEANVEQAEAAVELAELNLADTTIEAPFAGVIAELYISEGSTVSQQGAIANLVSQTVEVNIEVEESRIGNVFTGQEAALEVSAFPDETFPAEVTNVAPVADESTRTFTVKITPQDPDGKLRGGMFADVSVLAEERTGVTLVPREAVVLVDDVETVFVENNGVVEQREVETGIFDGERIEIISGVEPGERVVIAGQPNITDGAEVEVVNDL